ncbi:hypothetical protein DL95DRAFT_383351 [Leptodontidium sp. 2 PMI_412]|nr:hypothetical protein DL95DRAFT_383351 [Leptodontidium sp. 2 PMI_412]
MQIDFQRLISRPGHSSPTALCSSPQRISWRWKTYNSQKSRKRSTIKPHPLSANRQPSPHRPRNRHRTNSKSSTLHLTQRIPASDHGRIEPAQERERRRGRERERAHHHLDSSIINLALTHGV